VSGRRIGKRGKGSGGNFYCYVGSMEKRVLSIHKRHTDVSDPFSQRKMDKIKCVIGEWQLRWFGKSERAVWI
jgi:hypothetical protein